MTEFTIRDYLQLSTLLFVYVFVVLEIRHYMETNCLEF